MYSKFYRLTRKGYVLGEKLNNRIYQIVRAEHYKRKVHSANDFKMRSYVKAKLFANFSEEAINKYLEWEKTPERTGEVLKAVSDDEVVTSLIDETRNIRKKLVNMTRKISRLSDSHE